VPREEGGSQGLEKQEKVYRVHFELPLFVALGVTLIIFLIGSVVWNIYAYEFAELLHGKPVAPPGSLAHAWEVEDIEDLADMGRIFSLVFIILASVGLVVWAVPMLGGQVRRQIVLSDAGVVVSRLGLGPWGRPVVIRTISEMKEVRRGRALKVAGVTPEGRRVTSQFGRLDIGGKRWEEFKNDLQAYIAPTEKE